MAKILEVWRHQKDSLRHGLRTPNEGKNQRRIGPMWHTKYAAAIPINLGLGLNFRPCSEGYFLSGRP